MKVLTSRVVVFAIVSILTSFVAHAESKAVGDGDKTGGVTEDSKSDLVSIEDRKIVASKSYVDDEISALAAHTVNGAPLSNAANVFFGVGEGAASSTTKTARVPSIPVATFGTVPTGVIITVQPEYTAEAGFVLSLNGGRRANVLYNGAALTNADAPKIWNSKYPSTFVFNGVNWVFMGSGAVDENTEYDVMGVDEGTTGAATDKRTLTAANLKPIIQGTTLTNIDTTATTAVTASDTITTGIGKLQGQINALGANTLTWGASETTSANAYDTTFVGDDGATANAWPTADKTKLIDTAALANALALKQNKISSTSDGTNNTPNYVYNATTNSTADGSVLTTTTTAGIVGERGIATAPTYDANDNLTNGSWLPTMSAVESMVSGSDVSSHLVNGQPLSNNQITLYGEESSSSSSGSRRTVTLYDYSDPDHPTPLQIDSLIPGMVVVIKPMSAATSYFVINIDGTSGWNNIKYHGNNIPDTMFGKIWNPNSPSVLMYDGTDWNYIAGGEDNGVESLEWASNVHPAAVTGYSTAFTGTAQGAWNARDMYSFVKGPTFANALALKQNKLPALPTGNMAPDDIPLGGGMTLVLTDAPGVVETRYIAGSGGSSINVGGNLALADYVNGSVSLADYSTNSGLTGNQIRQTLVTLETLKDVYAEISEDISDAIEESAPTGTVGYVATYLPHTNADPAGEGKVGGEVAIYSGPTAQTPYNATNDANKLATAEFVETKQDKIDADMVGITMNGGDVDLPALLTYGTPDGNNGNDGLLGNKIGLLTYADYWNNFGDWTESYSPTTGWTGDMDNVVPTLRLVASELRKMYWSQTNSNELTAAINNYSTIFNGSTGNWPHSFESYGGPLVTLTVFGNALALKQNKITPSFINVPNIDPVLNDELVVRGIVTSNDTGTEVTAGTIGVLDNDTALSTLTLDGVAGSLRNVNYQTLHNVYPNNSTKVQELMTAYDSVVPTALAVGEALYNLQVDLESSDVSSHLVNGQPLSNNQITLYGTSDSAGTMKLVTLYDYSNPNSPTPIEIDALVPGMVIVIEPTVDQPANGSLTMIKITNVPNNAGLKAAKYRGRNIMPAVAQKIWKTGSPTVWVYDGTNFNYVSGGLDSGLTTLDWDGDRHPGIINAYNTDFDGATGHWWPIEADGLVKGETFANALALKQNALPAQASGAPVTIPTYPAYGTSDGVIGKMYLDTSSLYTANDEHFPSSKLINTTLSSYVPKSDALNTSDTNSNLAAVSGAPSWATTNGVASLYRVPGVASGSNWAATTMANWANDKNVPTMDTLANSLAGLYDAVGVSVEDRILNYDETGYSIGGASVPVPSQIEYTGESKLKDGNQLFWLPQLQNAGVAEAERLLKIYSSDKIVPTMDELAFALDGVLQTHETTSEWQEVVNFYGVPSHSLFEVAMAIEASDENAIALSKSGYLQTFAPTLEALMNESAELIHIIDSKQNKLSGTSGNLVTYGATAGTTGSKEIATTITNNANTVPNTQAVYNAVNARQIKIPQAGIVRNASGTMSAISDWTSASVKGTRLVTKTSSDGVVGERKIFEVGDTYTNDAATNIQIATIGAVMENTFTKKCAEYRPGTTGETAANCWLWNITSNTVTPACSANGSTCSSNSDCCSNYCNNNTRPSVCAARPQFTCAGEGASCSIVACCTGLTCNSQTNTCVNSVIKS